MFRPRADVFLNFMKSNPWEKRVAYTCLYTLIYILNPKHTIFTTFVAIILLSRYEISSTVVSPLKRRMVSKDLDFRADETVRWLPTLI